MIEIRKEPEIGPLTLPEELKTARRLVFYDIETTGLSAYSSSLYLIGALTLENGKCTLYQWFVPALSDELPVLRAFFSFLRPDDLLISFNGDTFDRNYLEACAMQYSIPSPLKTLESADLLKRVRKCRQLLQLPDLRQKSIEAFLGIHREDRFTGGELIRVYEEYTQKPSDEALRLLLLHNEEDLLGMPLLLPVLLYGEAVSAPGNPEEIWQNKSGSLLFVSYRFPHAFPRKLEYEDPAGIRCTFSEETLTVTIPVLHAELKYYFPNYRDYYYLPVEDRAIHKKLGRFVDKNFRVQASPENCFTKRSGLFVPALKGSGLPLYKTAFDADAGFHYMEDPAGFIGMYAGYFLSGLQKDREHGA